jgi:hypothetical protein
MYVSQYYGSEIRSVAKLETKAWETSDIFVRKAEVSLFSLFRNTQILNFVKIL